MVKFRLYEGDMKAPSVEVEGPVKMRRKLEGEIAHYAVQYEQDGPVRVVEVIRGKEYPINFREIEA